MVTAQLDVCKFRRIKLFEYYSSIIVTYLYFKRFSFQYCHENANELCCTRLLYLLITHILLASLVYLSAVVCNNFIRALLLLLLLLYSSWALSCLPLFASSPEWLPSSMQTRGRYSVASIKWTLNPPQLHVARYDWVYQSAASSQKD